MRSAEQSSNPEAASDCAQCVCNDGGQRLNPSLHVVVSDGLSSQDNMDEVSVEVRALDKVHAVKRQAYGQLQVWHRFSRFDGDKSLPPDESHGLPPLGRLSLAVVTVDGLERLMEDFLDLDHYDVKHGARLMLRCSDQWQELPETLTKPQDTHFDGLLHLTVCYEDGEVSISAFSNATVVSIKRQAVEQLAVWRRFAGQLEMPDPGDLNFHFANGQPLDETRSLASHSLQSGDRVMLQPLQPLQPLQTEVKANY